MPPTGDPRVELESEGRGRDRGKEYRAVALSAFSSALSETVFQFFFANHFDGGSRPVSDMDPHTSCRRADFRELGSFDFKNASSPAWRSGGAISVFFSHAGGADHDYVLGDDLFRISGASFCRRMRLRRSIATARFASFDPTRIVDFATIFARPVRQAVTCSSFFVRRWSVGGSGY